MTGRERVEQYLQQNYRIVTWPATTDDKGPKAEGWLQKIYTLADYHEGDRVGLILAHEVTPGRFLHDVDIDWAPGSLIAQAFLPATAFVFGRESKKVSHCFYTLSEKLPTFKYADIDKTALIEIRGSKSDGSIGFQTMAPPSIWSKDKKVEPLEFVKDGMPAFIDSSSLLRQRVCLAAIGMLLAKHLGHNGFGHDPRLAWAGFLLRAGIPIDDLVKMGEHISIYCNNKEVVDVRRVVESTHSALQQQGKKVAGGPTLAKILGEHGRSILARINEWLGRDSDFKRDKHGHIIRDDQDNVRIAVQLLDIEPQKNVFAEKIVLKDAEKREVINDDALKRIWFRIDREFRFRPTYQFFSDVVHDMALDTPYHPVVDYLNSLSWDKTPRIERWLINYGGAEDSEFIRAVSAIVLVAAVRRVRQPGCKYDEMLVLEGEQGLNKSSALHALCPSDEWFSDDLPLNVESKQVIEKTVGKWIVEASDLAGKRRTEIEQLKAMLSRQFDAARMSYAHLPIERKRQFIIIGTTNSSVYLTDPTGARRFWPVAIRAFDVAAIKRDRDQLWAEASALEQSGYSIRLPERLWSVAAVQQEQRSEDDAWETPILALLQQTEPASPHSPQVRVATSDLWDCIGIEPARRDRRGAVRISEIMNKYGFRRMNVRLGGGETQTGYGGTLEKIRAKLSDGATLLERQPGSDDVPF